jgi:hypothetical protein
MTGNVQLYLPERGLALARMPAPLGGFGLGVKVGSTDPRSRWSRSATRLPAIARTIPFAIDAPQATASQANPR